MAFQVGDRVVAESESTQRRPRAGTVREVVRENPPRYRIEWDDGHESIYAPAAGALHAEDRKSTRLNSSHPSISYAVFCLKKKKKKKTNYITCRRQSEYRRLRIRGRE